MGAEKVIGERTLSLAPTAQGTRTARKDRRCDPEDAGYIKASLVQFGEAIDHGISSERLGDGIDGCIAEYWEFLYDSETGY
jgi:hypothetical protein